MFGLEYIHMSSIGQYLVENLANLGDFYSADMNI